MGPQPNSCGNKIASRGIRLASIASMGPQPNSCGNDPKQLDGRRSPLVLQWGHSQTAVETTLRRRTARRAPSGFNGATAKQLWKRSLSLPTGGCRLRASMGPQPNSCGNASSHSSCVMLGRLQWGHSQTAVETSFLFTASPRRRAGFNGATAKQLWKRWIAEVLGDDVLASMGPQPNSCGNSITRVPPHHRQRGSLQWGHSQTAVETICTRRAALESPIASMGPQPNSCGNTAPP